MTITDAPLGIRPSDDGRKANTMTDNITFERFARECGANDTARAKGWTLIYDFKVMIDGEHRATLSKNTCGRGYEIYDADHRPIHGQSRSRHFAKHLGEEVAKQADFFQFVSDLLASGRIPTLSQMADLRAQEAQKAAEIDRQARQEIRHEAARASGPQLLSAIKYLLAVVNPDDPDHELVLENEAETAAAQERHPSFDDMKAYAFAEARRAIDEAENLGNNFEERVEAMKWQLSR